MSVQGGRPRGEPGGSTFLPLSLGAAPDGSWNQVEQLGVKWDRQVGVGWRARGLGGVFRGAPLLSVGQGAKSLELWAVLSDPRNTFPSHFPHI